MQTVSDDQADSNSIELRRIELEVIEPLEEGFTKLDALETERVRLESEVKRAITEETAILADESVNEKDAVRKLLQVRALRDVQTSRLGAAERRVDEQRLNLLESAAIVRRKLGNLLHHVRSARTKRASAIIEDLIEGPVRFGPIGLGDLVRRTKIVREIELAINRISTAQNIDQQIELDTLRQFARQWFKEVESIVLAEPSLNLQNLLPKQKPVEMASEIEEVAA
jgi:hypothetical protein